MYCLNPLNRFDDEIAAKQWIQNKVSSTLNPLLRPHYQLKFYENHFRLLPLTPEAKESRKTDNEAYQHAVNAVTSSIDTLEKAFKALSLKLKQKIEVK